MNSTVLYFYDDEKLIKIENIYESGSFITEYIYEGQTKKIIQRDTDGEIVNYIEGIVDDQENMLTLTSYDAEGNVTGSAENFYENNQLITTVSEGFDEKLVTHHYEYNNIGDKIFWYIVHHGEQPIIIVYLYEYEYNNDMLPKNVTEYRVQSPISEEDIRYY